MSAPPLVRVGPALTLPTNGVGPRGHPRQRIVLSAQAPAETAEHPRRRVVASRWQVSGACLTPEALDRLASRFVIDRTPKVLETAGATSVQKVYIDRITCNYSHQHGTHSWAPTLKLRSGRPVSQPQDRQPLCGRRWFHRTGTGLPHADDHGRWLASRRAHGSARRCGGVVDLGRAEGALVGLGLPAGRSYRPDLGQDGA
jgi:hypothetical protein